MTLRAQPLSEMSAQHPTAPEAELLERANHLSLLTQWRAAIGHTGGLVVLIGGEAGVGKSALLRQFVRDLGREARVLWGGCDPLTTPHPFGPLHDIARVVGGQLPAALKSGDREVIFAALLDELERPRDAPVLVLEDVHWADEATLDLLKFLGRRIARTRTLMLVTYRDDEVDAQHPARAAFGNLPSSVVRRMRLDPLTEQAVSALAVRSGRDPAGLFGITFGNPFYVTEVLAADSGVVPHSVRDAVLARIAALSPAAREVAYLASVVPGRIEPWLIQAILPVDEASIDECRSSGMDRLGDGSLVFRHEISRRAVEDSLASQRRCALHAAVLRVLEERQEAVAPARLVHHAVGAQDIAAIQRHALRAARQAAQVGAHRETIAHCRTALQYDTGLATSTRAELLDLLAYECYLIDQAGAALQAREALLEIWRDAGDPLRVGDTLRWMSRLCWFCGRGFDAQRFAHEAVQTLLPFSHSRELAMAYSNVAQLAMLAGNSAMAIEWGEKAIVLARELRDDSTLAHALNNVGTARSSQVGDTGWRELEESLALSLEHGLQEHAARAYTNLVTTAILRREYPTAERHVEAALTYCERHELDAWSKYIRAFRGRLRLERGQWADAAMDAEAILTQGDVSIIQRIPAALVLGTVRSRRGDEGARELLQEALTLAHQTDELQRLGPALAALAEWAWLNDDAKTLDDCGKQCAENVSRTAEPWMRGMLYYWAWRAGRAHSMQGAIAEPFRLQIAGRNTEASEQWLKLGCQYEAACALADSDAEADRRQALAIFDELEARPLAMRLRKSLRAAGVRGVKRGAHSSTRANPGGLTAREIEILKLLSTGQSNAVIAKQLSISAKTVGHHVSAILEKLGVATRFEAATAAQRLGIVQLS